MERAYSVPQPTTTLFDRTNFLGHLEKLFVFADTRAWHIVKFQVTTTLRPCFLLLENGQSSSMVELPRLTNYAFARWSTRLPSYTCKQAKRAMDWKGPTQSLQLKPA